MVVDLEALLHADVDDLERLVPERVAGEGHAGGAVRAVGTAAVSVGIQAHAGVDGPPGEDPEGARDVEAVGQEEEHAAVEVVATVQARGSILRGEVEVVLDRDSARVALVVVVGLRLAEDVEQVRLAPLALELGADRERPVERAGGGLPDLDAAQRGDGTRGGGGARQAEERPLRGVGGPDDRRRQVQLAVALQAVGLHDRAVDADGQAIGHLALETEAGLVRARVLEVVVHGDRLRAGEGVEGQAEGLGDRRHLLRRQHRQRVQRRPVQVDADEQQLPVDRRVRVAGGCAEGELGGEVARRQPVVVHRPREQEGRAARVIDAAEAAHDHLGVVLGIPREAHAGTELRELVGDDRGIGAAADGEGHALDPVVQAGVAGVGRRVPGALPAHAEVDGQVGPDAPVVLGERRHLVGREVEEQVAELPQVRDAGVVEAVGHAAARGQDVQQARRVAAADVEDAELVEPERLGDEDVVVLHADLGRVGAADPGEVGGALSAPSTESLTMWRVPARLASAIRFASSFGPFIPAVRRKTCSAPWRGSLSDSGRSRSPGASSTFSRI